MKAITDENTQAQAATAEADAIRKWQMSLAENVKALDRVRQIKEHLEFCHSLILKRTQELNLYGILHSEVAARLRQMANSAEEDYEELERLADRLERGV